jgi:hypothetical protein
MDDRRTGGLLRLLWLPRLLRLPLRRRLLRKHMLCVGAVEAAA